MGKLICRLLAALFLVSAATWADEQAMVRLPIRFPRPAYSELPIGDPPPDVEPFRADVPLPWVPRTIRQVALGRQVSSSARVIRGTLALVTDGNKEGYDDAAVELDRRTQWVQIDLGRAHELWAVAVWHFHRDPVVVHDVVVQVSNDPSFGVGVATLFNNDADNSSGLGVGQDREYWDSHLGRIVDARRAQARYVRLYSRGSTYSDPINRYTEVEVWATEPTGPAWVPLPIVYPRATTPHNEGVNDAYRAAANLVGADVPMPPTATPPTPLAPATFRQLASGRLVSASSKPLAGWLAQVTDGHKEARAANTVELPPGSQWVQVDLGRERALHYLGLWHSYIEPGTIVCGVLVQVSNDPTFSTGVRTLHNSDRTGCHGQDRGQDPFYFESNLGRLINAGGVKARYVRCWSAGSTCGDARNRWTEIEAWGL